MATLEENITQAIADFDDIEAAIEEQGVDVPKGTDTSEYGNLIRSIANAKIYAGTEIFALTDISGGGVLKYYETRTLPPYKVGDIYVNTETKNVFMCSNIDVQTLTLPSGNLYNVTVSWDCVNNVKTDQAYNPKSKIPQSGTAVAEALAGLPIKYVESLDTDNPVYLRSLESGTYILYGKFRPHNGSTSICTFSTGMLVSVIRNTSISYMQIFYSKNNTIQYCEITDDTYERKDAKLINMESTANLTTTIDENSDDTHYPSAKAVYDKLEIKRIKSLDKNNPLYFRDIESGYYIFHGYFRPYPDSPSFITMDTMYFSVSRLDEGSHLMSISPLNFRITCYEILVDETAEDGFTYTSTRLNLLDLNDLKSKVGALETQTGDVETALDNIIAIQNQLIGGDA